MQIFRSYLFLLWMFSFSVAFGILALPCLLRREWSLAASSLWARGILGGLTVLCGIDDRIMGLENAPQGAAIIASKHQSMWETLRLQALLPRPSFVLKKELKQWPIFSWYCRANGFIFVDRDAGAKALRDMTTQAKDRLSEGAQIVIFPEGTRSRPGERLPYQPGVAALAKSLGIPTVPVSHDSGRYWVQPGALKTPGTITLTLHPAIPEASHRKTYLRALEGAIEGDKDPS